MTVSRPDRHEARSSYPTDLTDAEWHALAPYLPTEKPRGRPRKHPVREILNAILYVVRGGCPWRMLPHDFPTQGYRVLLVQAMASGRALAAHAGGAANSPHALGFTKNPTEPRVHESLCSRGLSVGHASSSFGSAGSYHRSE